MRLTRHLTNEELDIVNYHRNDLEKRTYAIKIGVGTYDIENKLGQLEDIEEELGIDLVTLFKALKNGIYVKDNDLLTFPCLSVKGKMLFTMPTMRTFELKDYGKT